MNYLNKNMFVMVPISIIIPTKNEEKNLARCLEPIYKWASEIIIVDSGSVDRTESIAESFGVKFIDFQYQGGWPKKRQWALENIDFNSDWVLLLDSDEILLPDIKKGKYLWLLKVISMTDIGFRFKSIFLANNCNMAARS